MDGESKYKILEVRIKGSVKKVVNISTSIERGMYDLKYGKTVDVGGDCRFIYIFNEHLGNNDIISLTRTLLSHNIENYIFRK